MRRTNEQNNPLVHGPIRTLWPVLTWHTCDSCGDNVKGEIMWQALTPPYCGGQGTRRYLCMTCAHNRMEAQKYFHTGAWRPNKPNVTPPPCPPRKR